MSDRGKESGKESTLSGNPFVADDLGSMSMERRQAYVAHLQVVQEKLAALTRLSEDGASLDALLVEVDAVLGMLRAQDTDRSGPDEA